MRDARAVMHVEIANQFSAHAQLAILHIWQEVHFTRYYKRTIRELNLHEDPFWELRKCSELIIDGNEFFCVDNVHDICA